MSTLGTIREKIKRTTSRKSAADDHHVLDAIESICQRHYRRQFRFNTRVQQFDLNGEMTERSPDGKLDNGLPDPDTVYYFPWDVLRWIRISRITDEYPRLPMEPMKLSDLTTQWGYWNWSMWSRGIPRGYATEGQDKLWVRPGLSSPYPIEAEFVYDTARPVLSWEDGTWIVRDSVTGAKMDDETESPWFDEAADLVHWGACTELFFGIYGDSEKGQRAERMEQRALKDLERFNSMIEGPRTARAHFT